MQILEVAPGSLAAQAGLLPGNRILAVNGRTVRDFLDLHLWLGEEVLDLTVLRPEAPNRPEMTRVVRRYGEELGLTFAEPPIRRCANDCPFCFVDQLPPGLRKNLYIRDDDYRFSYLYGHFVTLTNLRESEFQRILDQQLSPLYVSVHALDPKVREKVLVSKKAGEIRARIEQLVRGGIELHTQIVVVPGVNDGKVLHETIFGLAAYWPGVKSVSVVPVGLTAHRGGLAPVRVLTRSDAREVAETVRRYGRAMRRRLGAEFCFVADELVLLAGRPIPSALYYGNFEQRENGVGLVRSALLFLKSAGSRGAALRRRGIRRVLLLTGESFGPTLESRLPDLRRRAPEVTLEVVTVKNRLFGRPVTVAGLLGGSDLLRAAREHVRPGDMVLIPDEAVNDRGVFLDDWTPQRLSAELGVEAVPSWEPLFVDSTEASSPDVRSTEPAFFPAPQP